MLKSVRSLYQNMGGEVERPAIGHMSGTFGTIPAGNNYYLNVWLINEDHWHHTGDGTINVSY